MAVLSLGEIPELQKLIQPYGYKIHVHDACGGQSFSLEPISDNPSEEVHYVLEDFFKSHKMSVSYYGNDKLNFVAR